MFVYCFDHIKKPLEVAAQGLCQLSQPVLSHFVEEAYERGEVIRTRVAVGNGFKLSNDVEVSLGPTLESADGISRPIHVRATGTASLLPRLEANIELTRLGPELTHLSLSGSYRPPLGFVGEAADHRLLHRVAEAAVKALVEQLCMSLDQVPDNRADTVPESLPG